MGAHEGRADERRHVVEQADDTDLGGRGDRATLRFVVERDVAPGDRQTERAARVAEAADALGQLPERLGSGRVAVVQAVRHTERAGACDRDVARRLGDRQRRAQPRIERRRRPRCRRSRRRAPSSSPSRAGRRHRDPDRRPCPRRPSSRTGGTRRGARPVRRTEEAEQDGARVHPSLRQAVGRLERAHQVPARRGGGPAAHRSAHGRWRRW